MTINQDSVQNFEQYGRYPFWFVLSYNHPQDGEKEITTNSLNPLVMLENPEYELPRKSISHFWTYFFFILAV